MGEWREKKHVCEREGERGERGGKAPWGEERERGSLNNVFYAGDG